MVLFCSGSRLRVFAVLRGGTQGWMMYVLILCNMLAFGTGPALQAYFSRAVDARSQGAAMGSLSSLASLMSVRNTHWHFFAGAGQPFSVRQYLAGSTVFSGVCDAGCRLTARTSYPAPPESRLNFA
jgi:hypothetical protein